MVNVNKNDTEHCRSRSRVSIVNNEHFFLVLLLLNLNREMLAGQGKTDTKRTNDTVLGNFVVDYNQRNT